MKLRYSSIFIFLLILLAIAACSPSAVEPAEEATPTPEPVATEVAPTNPPDCLGEDTIPIVQSISEEYENATYEDVMTWFCNGAEFEDIITALETNTLVDTPVKDLLQKLADGLTWEEIWQSEGLMDS